MYILIVHKLCGRIFRHSYKSRHQIFIQQRTQIGAIFNDTLTLSYIVKCNLFYQYTRFSFFTTSIFASIKSKIKSEADVIIVESYRHILLQIFESSQITDNTSHEQLRSCQVCDDVLETVVQENDLISQSPTSCPPVHKRTHNLQHIRHVRITSLGRKYYVCKDGCYLFTVQ